jgi:menaquinol-cytochrome c reductase iron-sulfur subunit
MPDPNIPPEPRRSFLAKLFAIVGGGVALLVPTTLGIASFFNPLRPTEKKKEDFTKITTLEVLPEDGTPMKFAVIADRTDAWNHYPQESIGAVYLRRLDKKDGKAEVEALQVICPHAGCSIMYEAGEKGGKFYCPCHGASFDLAGTRTDAVSQSPRDMDTLETKVENGEVFVKFQSFTTGTSLKKAQA